MENGNAATACPLQIPNGVIVCHSAPLFCHFPIAIGYYHNYITIVFYLLACSSICSMYLYCSQLKLLHIIILLLLLYYYYLLLLYCDISIPLLLQHYPEDT